LHEKDLLVSPSLVKENPFHPGFVRAWELLTQTSQNLFPGLVK
jgi:hypothetical protein